MNIISENLLTFIKNSPSAFHSVASIKKILYREGFIELAETQPFCVKKGGKYFVTRNGSSIIAFKVGDTLDNYQFNMVASHSDCPGFKVKPNASKVAGEYANVAVEGYGGMLCATWFDRPLSLAGRVILKKETTLIPTLVNFDRNLCSIPSIAIHMNREANSGYKYNLAIDMQPTLGSKSETQDGIKELIASELKVSSQDVLSYDLYLYHHTQGYFWGNNEEYISSPKLDDLQCAYTTLLGFCKASNPHNINVYCCFDNEEVGSTTQQGANSTFLEDTLKKLSNALGYSENEHKEALAKSFMVSADNAHAIHPTHPELSDSLNAVYMNKGIVIKYNASQSYCTDAYSSAIFKEICKKANVPTQDFANRSDMRGGSTLGNISTTHVSLLSLDIGLAQLAMHSANETAGSLDSEYMVNAIKTFYETNLYFKEDGSVYID